MATNSNVEVLSAEATLAGEVTITVISSSLPREDGHIAVLDSNDVEIARGVTTSPSPGGSSSYDSVFNIPVGRYQATWYSETYGEYVNKIPITVGNPDSKFYGPERRLASIGSYTLESLSPFDPAIVSIDLVAFKNFLNSQINYIKTINSEATFSKIAVYVAYVDNIYRFRISLATGGSGTALRGYTDADHDALISTVRNNTGISLNPTFGSMTQVSNIVPDGVTYVYDSKRVSKFYGSVNGQTKEITKLYGSVNGQTKLIYEKGA